VNVPALDRLFEMPHVVINFFFLRFIFMNCHHRFIKDFTSGLLTAMHPPTRGIHGVLLAPLRNLFQVGTATTSWVLL